MIPTLETERLTLLPPALLHFDMYQAFYTDGHASAMYGGPISNEQVWARLKADVGSWALLGFGVWVIQVKDTQQFVGTCGFWQGKAWPRELTWWITPDARGKGIALEASRAAIHYAYNSFGWENVQTYMNDDNIAARNLVLKLGGEKIDRQQFDDGQTRDIYRLPNG